MATNPSAQPAGATSDIDLVHAISRAFVESAQVDHSALRVAVENGRAKLTGRVATHAQRLAAANLVARVPGVSGVDNRLTVRDVDLDVVTRTDAEISEAVSGAIVSSTIPVADLRFEVRHRVVTVEGRVRSERDRASLRHAIQEVPGVHFVESRIEVAPDAAGFDAEELDPAACFRLLATEKVGRLAVQEGAGVDVFPVNYLVHDGRIYFRSGPGVKLVRLTAAPDVAFEVDGHDRVWSWSVVVKGLATRVSDDDEIHTSGIVDAPTAHPSEKHVYVRITPRQVTGRRFRHER